MSANRTLSVAPFSPNQERVAYMGERKAHTVVVDRASAAGRARCRKDRERIVREIRATLDEVRRNLAGGVEPDTEEHVEMSRSGIANAVRAARYTGGSLVVSYLDGTSREPAEIHQYNAHVREAMIAILIEEEYGPNGPPESDAIVARQQADTVLPDASLFAPPVMQNGEFQSGAITPGILTTGRNARSSSAGFLSPPDATLEGSHGGGSSRGPSHEPKEEIEPEDDAPIDGQRPTAVPHPNSDDDSHAAPATHRDEHEAQHEAQHEEPEAQEPLTNGHANNRVSLPRDDNGATTPGRSRSVRSQSAATPKSGRFTADPSSPPMMSTALLPTSPNPATPGRPRSASRPRAAIKLRAYNEKALRCAHALMERHAVLDDRDFAADFHLVAFRHKSRSLVG